MQSAFILARRAARSRASILATLLALTFSACNSDELTNTTDAVTPTTTDDLSNSGDVTEEPVTAVEIPSQSLSYAGGIAFGTFHQPTSVFGTTYNGALRNIYPNELVAQLQAIRSRGGRVVLNMAGSQSRYRDRNHNFSLTMWKASIDRFKNVNITPFINDGTIIASFLIDEPHNTSRWNGKVVSYATLELMARYSKSRWPGLATVVRAYPVWLAKYSGSYRYLDGAWGQYVARFGRLDLHEDTDGRRSAKGTLVGCWTQHSQRRSWQHEDERQPGEVLRLSPARQLAAVRLHQLGIQLELPVVQQRQGCDEVSSVEGSGP